MNDIKLVCFGEVLVDQFPSGDKPGGAPMNVAYHLNNLGTQAGLVSSVGRDAIGEDLLKFMNDKGIDTSMVQQHPELASGTVQVDISDKNEAQYTISEPVAWDDIHLTSDLSTLQKTEYIVHGSLALRSEQNRKTLQELADKTDAKVVFDLNLRPPFYSKELLVEQIKASDIIKLNKEEFELVARWMGVRTDETGLFNLLSKFDNLEMILVTLGGDGAIVQTKSELIKSKVYKVNVMDTVGAGDSFLASFIHGLVQENSVQEVINFASATGALVASKAGANPEYTINDIHS